MKALFLTLSLLISTSAFAQSPYHLPALNSEDPRDDREFNCCTAADPVDSNMCFDSWEEYDQACKTPQPAPETPPVDDDKRLD